MKYLYLLMILTLIVLSTVCSLHADAFFRIYTLKQNEECPMGAVFSFIDIDRDGYFDLLEGYDCRNNYFSFEVNNISEKTLNSDDIILMNDNIISDNKINLSYYDRKMNRTITIKCCNEFGEVFVTDYTLKDFNRSCGTFDLSKVDFVKDFNNKSGIAELQNLIEANCPNSNIDKYIKRMSKDNFQNFDLSKVDLKVICMKTIKNVELETIYLHPFDFSKVDLNTTLNVYCPDLMRINNFELNYDNKSANNIDLIITPNPIINNGTLFFNLMETSYITIKLISETGKSNLMIDKKLFQEGQNQIELDFTNYGNGVYVIQMIIGNHLTNKKVIIAR